MSKSDKDKFNQFDNCISWDNKYKFFIYILLLISNQWNIIEKYLIVVNSKITSLQATGKQNVKRFLWRHR